MGKKSRSNKSRSKSLTAKHLKQTILDKVADAPNKFELVTPRRASRVLGQRQRAEPLLQKRARGEEKRRETLLKEVKAQRRRNIVVDQRFDRKRGRDMFNLNDDDTVLNDGALAPLAYGQGDFGEKSDDEVLLGDPRSELKGHAVSGKRAHAASMVAKGRMFKQQKKDQRHAQVQLLETINDDQDLIHADLIKAVPRAPRSKSLGGDYDALLAELAQGKRAKGSEKLKPTELVAREQRKELERLEKARRSRLAGDPDLESDSASSDDRDVAKRFAQKTVQLDHVQTEPVVLSGTERSRDSIPFVLSAPVSLDEFLVLVDGLKSADVIEVIARIVKSNPVEMKQTNAVKLARLTEILFAFAERLTRARPVPLSLLNKLVAPLGGLCADHAPTATQAAQALITSVTPSAMLQDLPKQLDALEKHVMENIEDDEAAYEALEDGRDALMAEATRTLSRVRAHMPSLSQLLLMRLQVEVWSNKDSRHPILTPLALRCGQALTCARVETLHDVYSGLFCVGLMRAVVEQTQQWAAEPIQFLTALLTTLLEFDDPDDPDYATVGVRRAVAPIPEHFLLVKDAAKRETLVPRDLTLTRLVKTLSGGDRTLLVQDQMDVTQHALRELTLWLEMYSEMPAAPEVLQRTDRLLRELYQAVGLPSAAIDLCAGLHLFVETHMEHVRTTRRPLALQARVAEARSRSFVSKEVAMPKDRRDMTVTAKRRKMQSNVREQTRAAARELRKDSLFLARVQQDEWRAQREEIDKREREIIGELSKQQGEINILEGKKKKKRGNDFNTGFGGD